MLPELLQTTKEGAGRLNLTFGPPQHGKPSFNEGHTVRVSDIMTLQKEGRQPYLDLTNETFVKAKGFKKGSIASGISTSLIKTRFNAGPSTKASEKNDSKSRYLNASKSIHPGDSVDSQQMVFNILNSNFNHQLSDSVYTARERESNSLPFHKAVG